jgi:hypothetical protein
MCVFSSLECRRLRDHSRAACFGSAASLVPRSRNNPGNRKECTMSNTIQARAMLVDLSLRCFSSSKKDKEVSREVADKHGTNESDGSFTKQIIAKDALARIKSIQTQARTEHYFLTLAWTRDGLSLLPSALYERYSATMGRLRIQHEIEVERFVQIYPNMVDEARMRLRGLFRESDYLAPSKVRDKFGFKVSFMPVPDAKDFRTDCSDAQVEEIRRQIEQSTNDAMVDAMRSAVERVQKRVSHLAEKIAGYVPRKESSTGRTEEIFRDSLIENVKELADVLPALNVMGDAKLDQMITDIKALTRYDAKVLRDDVTRREIIADEAKQILDNCSVFLG